jgi:hypothetical protein
MTRMVIKETRGVWTRLHMLIRDQKLFDTPQVSISLLVALP